MGPAHADTGRSTYIVRAVPGQLPAVTAELSAMGGTVTRRIALIDAAVVSLPNRALPALRNDRRVTGVTPDAHVQLMGTQRNTLSTTSTSTSTTSTSST